MKPFILFLLLFAVTHFTHAQEIFRAKTALSVNMGVHYSFLSHPRVCFEREVVHWPKRGVSMGFRLGYGRVLELKKLAIGSPWIFGATGMGAAYVLTGRKNHHFEAAVGPEFIWFDDNDYTPPLLPYAEAGYRYQKPSSGLFVRGFVGSTSGIGLGVGYSFPVKNK